MEATTKSLIRMHMMEEKRNQTLKQMILYGIIPMYLYSKIRRMPTNLPQGDKHQIFQSYSIRFNDLEFISHSNYQNVMKYFKNRGICICMYGFFGITTFINSCNAYDQHRVIQMHRKNAIKNSFTIK